MTPAAQAEPLFENYTRSRQRVPVPLWQAARFAALVAVAGIVWLLVRRPEEGLQLLWKVAVPSLPLVFALAPGFWRNVCPMAFLNQLPRMAGLSLGWTLPQWLRVWCYAISTGLLILFVTLRDPVLDHDGPMAAAMIGGALAMALLGGLLFKGRSGWCGTFCPLAPIQKVHGQAPIMLVRNAYCPTCVGCQKNCYDFNPRATVFGDLYDRDERHAGQRRFFIAMLPGLILGYFTLAGTSRAEPAAYLFLFGLFMLFSVGLFQLLVNFIKVSVYKVATSFGIFALLAFYFFAAGGMARALASIAGLPAPAWISGAMQALVVLVGAGVVVRALRTEAAYSRVMSSANQLRVAEGARLTERLAPQARREVTERTSGRVIALAEDQTLLEGLEDAGVKINYGCRMGLCGADPVGIVEGEANLEPPGADETATLRRLGLDGRARLACACRVKGPVTIDLNPGKAVAPAVKPGVDHAAVAGVKRVVVIGNGVAGMSAVDALRRLGPSCAIDVVARESHHYYNRMSIGRVVYGRTAMDGLQLLPDEWFERNRVEVWRNTMAARIDREARKVVLGTGETLDYDRLIIATGAEAETPAPGFAPHHGCFVLRHADDAAAIRHWCQERAAKTAIVLGGGVLGIEAADALSRLGLKVTLLHRAAHLMNRQIDEAGGRLLAEFLAARGIETHLRVAMQGIRLHGARVAVTAGGEALLADVCVASIGIRPNIGLAEAAGLAVRRGIVVDAGMRTSDPLIFAAGDVAELPRGPSGLWPVGAGQGEVAAANALGEARIYAPPNPPVRLKCEGIDVFSFGELDAAGEVASCAAGSVARRIVVDNGRIVAACSVGEPGSSKALAAAVQANAVIDARSLQCLVK